MRGWLTMVAIGIVLMGSPVFAQDSTRHHSLGVTLGVTNVHNKDEFHSPYTYNGRNFLLGLSYFRTTSRNSQEVLFDLSTGHLHSSVSPAANSQVGLLSYDYFFRTKAISNKLSGALGLGLHAMATRVNYLPDVELPKSYLTAGTFLAAGGRLRYSISRRSALEFNASISTLGVVYRPDFDINGKSLTGAAFWGNSLFYTVKLSYIFQLNPKLDFVVSYRYQYFGYNEPRPIYFSQNGLSIGLRIKGGH
jgi:hypothetical protein